MFRIYWKCTSDPYVTGNKKHCNQIEFGDNWWYIVLVMDGSDFTVVESRFLLLFFRFIFASLFFLFHFRW